MSYCRERHTLLDNEAEAGWDRLPPGSTFELVVLAVTYYGIVDEYVSPTPTILICHLYTDPARTILHTAPIATGTPYEINNGVDYLHDAKDLQLANDGAMGVWRSPVVSIRDDTGVWNGSWIAEPKPDEEVQFNFDGIHTLFKVSVEAPLASEVAGAGLGAGNYQYCIVPVDGGGRLGAGSRVLTVTLAGAADILIDWLPNTQVTQWNVYGRISGGTFGLMTTLPGATVSLLDDGTLVPNPAFQPPLLEDPAWTVAIANREQDGTDGDVIYDVEGLEDGTTKLDDGRSISTYTAGIDADIENTAESKFFTLQGLVSHAGTRADVVLDPALFTQDVGPVEDLPPKVTTYDYHVFINTDGDTVITESDSFTGQTTTIVVNLVSNTFDITLSDNNGVLASDSIPISDEFTIPAPGSMSAQVTQSNFRTLTDGTIIGDEVIEANTYQVTPQTSPGFQYVSSQDFGAPATSDMAWTNDSWATKTVFQVPGTRWVLPGGFTTNRIPFMRAHGHGWTVGCSVNHPTIPNSVSDIALHWTPDLSLTPWPFNDAGGRVAGGMTVNQFRTLVNYQKSGNNNSHFDIFQCANGLGPFMQKQTATQDQRRNSFFGEDEIDFFFPATNTYTFQTPGATKYRNCMIWEEKNLLIGLDSAAINNIWINPLTTNEASPLGAQQFVQAITLPFTPNAVLAMGTTRDRAFIIWRRSFSSEIGWSYSSDGLTWTTALLNNTNDQNPNTPGNEPVGLRSGNNSDPKRDGTMMYLLNTAEIQYSTDNGSTWQKTTPAKPAAFWDGWEYFPWQHGEFGEVLSPNTPLLWDGIGMGIPGPNTLLAADEIRRHDGSLPAMTDLAPDTSGAFGWPNAQDINVNYGTTLGSAGSPNGIPAANLRRYMGRSVIIPNGIANPPAPFVIRDPTKSAVYDSSRTKTRNTTYGSMRATITEGPGGLGSLDITRIEDGQQILINIPNSSAAYAAAKKPIPVNMKWTSTLG